MPARYNEATQFQGHLPPQNLDAERSVIASVLLMREAFDEAGDILKAEHFYEDRHQTIWQVIADLHGREAFAVDAVTLAEELDRRQKLVEIGGAEYLGQILSTVPNAAHARHYAKIVTDRWRQRSLIRTCTDVLGECYAGGAEAQELVDSAEQRILALSASAARLSVVSVRDIVLSAYTEIQGRMKAGKAIGAPTGFSDLDRLIVGLSPKTLNVIAARPSVGKTAFACKIALSFARRGETVLFFSIEMGVIEIAERLACIHGLLDAHELKEGRFSGNPIEQEQKRDRLMTAFGEVAEMPIFIDDDGSPTIAHIAATSRRTKRKHGLGLVVIDYLQLIEPDDRREVREQQVAKISRALKALSKELAVPVVVLAQLNRAVEQREDKRPRLSDLRESGSVEQDADMVWFLHRPELYDPDDRRGEADVIVAKNRGGKLGTVALHWKGESTLFTDFAEKAYSSADTASRAFAGHRNGKGRFDD